MTPLTQAVEGSNKGELFSSYDVEAFEVPGGRDELWRFTPLRRLRGLHDGSAVATADPAVGVTAGDGVTVETVDRADERLGKGGVPSDRVAAQAYSAFGSATVVSVGKQAVVAEPIEIAVTGPGQGAVAYVTLGGDLVRLTGTVRFEAPGGDAELLGLYYADDGQFFEHRLLVDHAQPNCRSHVTYKGALQGSPASDKPDAHTVWSRYATGSPKPSNTNSPRPIRR